VRSGRRAAIDVGKARIGIAASDLHGILASGLATISRSDDLAQAVQLVADSLSEVDPIEIYVGLPLNLRGEFTESTNDALHFAAELAKLVTSPIRFIDERMTTNTAANALKLSGRDSKSGRAVIDQIAATVILEQALSIEKSTGASPGQAIEDVYER
jgi:putative Holliday junction resolvase